MKQIKQVIKRIAADINATVEANDYANEMAALIDCGEWSQTAPNFYGVIKKWNLDLASMQWLIIIADRYAKKFQEHYPKHGPSPNITANDLNPWRQIFELLQTAFILSDKIK